MQDNFKFNMRLFLQLESFLTYWTSWKHDWNELFMHADQQVDHLLNGRHSPEVQRLHAHRGDQPCQPHPVEDAQRVRLVCADYSMYPSDNK